MMRSKAKWMCCMVAILGLVATGSQAALLDDDFTGSAGPLDSGTWTGIYGYTEDGTTYATHGIAAEGGFRSVSTFGGAGSPTITAEFLGVSTRFDLSTDDNYWGLWKNPAGSGWVPPVGVAFIMRDKEEGQKIRYVLVSGTRVAVATPFTLTIDALYDFRVVWTPGSDVKFYANAAGDVTWTLLHSEGASGWWGTLPSDPLPVRVRSESIGLDVDRITVVPEPATMAMLMLGLPLAALRRRQRA